MSVVVGVLLIVGAIALWALLAGWGMQPPFRAPRTRAALLGFAGSWETARAAFDRDLPAALLGDALGILFFWAAVRMLLAAVRQPESRW